MNGEADGGGEMLHGDGRVLHEDAMELYEDVTVPHEDGAAHASEANGGAGSAENEVSDVIACAEVRDEKHAGSFACANGTEAGVGGAQTGGGVHERGEDENEVGVEARSETGGVKVAGTEGMGGYDASAYAPLAMEAGKSVVVGARPEMQNLRK